MPLYNLACRASLPSDIRQQIATAIMHTHCEQTGAPAQFVNVVFMDNYPLPAQQTVSVLGGVRTGGNRTPESILRLKNALHDAITDALGSAKEAVGMSLVGIPSNWIVEGGEVMPEPGSEAEQAVARAHSD